MPRMLRLLDQLIERSSHSLMLHDPSHPQPRVIKTGAAQNSGALVKSADFVAGCRAQLAIQFEDRFVVAD